MKVSVNEAVGIVSRDVYDINNREMGQMYELRMRIEQVLKSHKGEGKKEYLNDEELQMLQAILFVFTRDYSAAIQTSAFDDALQELQIPECEIVESPIYDPFNPNNVPALGNLSASWT